MGATESASLPGSNGAASRGSGSVFPLNRPGSTSAAGVLANRRVQAFQTRPLTVAAAAPTRTGGKPTHPGKAILAGNFN